MPDPTRYVIAVHVQSPSYPCECLCEGRDVTSRDGGERYKACMSNRVTNVPLLRHALFVEYPNCRPDTTL